MLNQHGLSALHRVERRRELGEEVVACEVGDGAALPRWVGTRHLVRLAHAIWSTVRPR